MITPRYQPMATVAFNMRSQRGPWGGSSTFVTQLRRHLHQTGYRTTYRLASGVDCIVLIDPRQNLEGRTFGVDDVSAYRSRNPEVCVVHRINECDMRKDTAFMDLLLADANDLADGTVFISQWLKAYHAERWFDAQQPHWVVYNGADDRYFHPIGSAWHHAPLPFRLVTHHWSVHPKKGFDVYTQVDRLIYEGRLPGFEFWVIGRWPKEIAWKAARTFPPCAGPTLAALLRQCHAYLTASVWEPCGMHHVEGAQCGLPLIYHEDGGGIVEAGRRYGISFRDDVRGAILEAKERYVELRRKVLQDLPSGGGMAVEYEKVIRQLLASGRPS